MFNEKEIAIREFINTYIICDYLHNFRICKNMRRRNKITIDLHKRKSCTTTQIAKFSFCFLIALFLSGVTLKLTEEYHTNQN